MDSDSIFRRTLLGYYAEGKSKEQSLDTFIPRSRMLLIITKLEFVYMLQDNEEWGLQYIYWEFWGIKRHIITISPLIYRIQIIL